MISQAQDGAMQLELTRRYGQHWGLTNEATNEVVDAWLAWHRVRPYAVDWIRIRNSLARRASGLEWRPVTDERGNT